MIDKLKSFFNHSAEKFGLSMAFLYGSYAGGNPREDSDVDVAVLFETNTLSKTSIFNRTTDLSIKLTSLLDKEVSILVLTREFKEPMLQYNAIVLGIPVYIKKAEQYIPLKMEAIFQMEDFSLFGRRWQLEVAERRLKGAIHG